MKNRTAAVITISDKGYRGERIDTSGPALCAILKERGYTISYTSLVPDEAEMIRSELLLCADEKHISLVLTTGGTGFSPRDITPEAVLSVLERQTPGIAEAMRAESMKITPRGCLSRSVAGIRGRTLVITLPGSEKAARENLLAVIDPVEHGLDMLDSEGSSDCADAPGKEHLPGWKTPPSMDEWLRDAKQDPQASKCGMFLVHNGIVRESARAEVRNGESSSGPVKGMHFSYDPGKVAAAIENTLSMPGIYIIRVWLNEGFLNIGDDIMYVLVGGDIRPHVIDALQALVGEIKTNCVNEQEIF